MYFLWKASGCSGKCRWMNYRKYMYLNLFIKKKKCWINAIAGQAGVHIEVLTDTVFAHASDTKTPQGVLCVVRQKSYKLEDLLKGEKRHLLVLDNLQDPGNMGTIVRTAEGAV